MKRIVKGWVVLQLVLEEMKIGVFRYFEKVCWRLNSVKYFCTGFITKLLQYTDVWQLKKQLKLIIVVFTVSSTNSQMGFWSIYYPTTLKNMFTYLLSFVTQLAHKDEADSEILRVGSVSGGLGGRFSFTWRCSGRPGCSSAWETEGNQTQFCRSPLGRRLVKEEEVKHPGIATADLTHQYFNQSGILFIFTLELLDTQGKYFFSSS